MNQTLPLVRFALALVFLCPLSGLAGDLPTPIRRGPPESGVVLADSGWIWWSEEDLAFQKLQVCPPGPGNEFGCNKCLADYTAENQSPPKATFCADSPRPNPVFEACWNPPLRWSNRCLACDGMCLWTRFSQEMWFVNGEYKLLTKCRTYHLADDVYQINAYNQWGSQVTCSTGPPENLIAQGAYYLYSESGNDGAIHPGLPGWDYRQLDVGSSWIYWRDQLQYAGGAYVDEAQGARWRIGILDNCEMFPQPGGMPTDVARRARQLSEWVEITTFWPYELRHEILAAARLPVFLSADESDDLVDIIDATCDDALIVDCLTAVRQSTWGSVKATYR